MGRTTIGQRRQRLYDESTILMVYLAGLILPIAHQFEAGNLRLDPGK